MTINAIAISRRLAESGMDRKTAEAVAEEIVTHSDETFATKADIAELKGEIMGEIKSLAVQVKLLTGLVIGLYIGLAALFVDRLAG